MSGNTESTSNSIKFAPMPMSALLANLMPLQTQPDTPDSSVSSGDSDDSTCETIAKKTPIKSKDHKHSTPTLKSHGREPKNLISDKKIISHNKENLDDNWLSNKTYLSKENILRSANKSIKFNPFPSSEVKKQPVLIPRDNNIQTRENVNSSAIQKTPDGSKPPIHKTKTATPKIKSGIRKFTPGSSRKSQRKAPLPNVLQNRDKVRCELFVQNPPANEVLIRSEHQTVYATSQVQPVVLAPIPATTAVFSQAVPPVTVSSPHLVSASGQALVSVPASTHAPVSLTASAYAPVSMTASGHAPISVPALGHAPVSVSASINGPVSVPASVHAPVSVPTSGHASVSMSAPAVAPVSLSVPAPIPVPETPVNRKKMPVYAAATPSYPQGAVGNGSKILFKTTSIKDKKYMFIRKLGTGGSSEVYKVLEVGTSCEYAVKCVYLAIDQDLAQGYINEVRLLRELQNSDRVIRLYDYEYDRTNQMLRMVLEVGETDLSSFLRARGAGLPPALVLHYWEEMLLAVHYIHEHGVIHADLKPANFLLVCGRLKLIDFGIASAISGDATSVVRAQAAGTYSYISPEALMGGAGGYGRADDNAAAPIKISFRSDVWSLGCILYSMVYGRTPFSHIPNLAKLAAILDPNHRIDYPPVDHLPPTLIASMKWCLTYNARARPSVRELLSVRHLAVPRSSMPQTLLDKLKPHLTAEELALLQRAQV